MSDLVSLWLPTQRFSTCFSIVRDFVSFVDERCFRHFRYTLLWLHVVISSFPTRVNELAQSVGQMLEPRDEKHSRSQSPGSFWPAAGIESSGQTRFSEHAQSIHFVFSANQICQI